MARANIGNLRMVSIPQPRSLILGAKAQQFHDIRAQSSPAHIARVKQAIIGSRLSRLIRSGESSMKRILAAALALGVLATAGAAAARPHHHHHHVVHHRHWH
jgi:hypothetical protein